MRLKVRSGNGRNIRKTEETETRKARQEGGKKGSNAS
jgi:hypothetical protein